MSLLLLFLPAAGGGGGPDNPPPRSQVASAYEQSYLAWQTTWGAQRSATIAPLTYPRRVSGWVRTGGGSALGPDDGSLSSGRSALCSAPVSVGDVVVVSTAWATNNASSSLVVDDLGNTYNLAVGAASIGDFEAGEIWVAFVTHAGTPTVTLSFAFGASTGYNGLLVDTFTGSDGSSFVDGSAGQPGSFGTGTDALTSGSFTTTHDGDLIVSSTQDVATGADTQVPGTGFVYGIDGGSGSSIFLDSEYLTQSTHGSVAGTWTLSVDEDHVTVAVAITPAVSGSLSPGAEPPRIGKERAALAAASVQAWQPGPWAAQRGGAIAPLVPPPPPWIRTGGGNNALVGGQTTVTATLSAAVSVGDFIGVGLTFNYTGAATSGVVTDSLGNNYVKFKSVDSVGQTQRDELWYAFVSYAGTPTITAKFNPTPGTSSAPGGVSLVASSFTGSSIASIIDGVGAGLDNTSPVSLATDAVVTGTFATAYDGDLLYSFGTSGMASAGTGFTLGSQNSGGDFIIQDEYAIQTTHSASTQATWTAASTSDKTVLALAVVHANKGPYRGGASANTDKGVTPVTELDATLGFALNLHDTVMVGVTYDDGASFPVSGIVITDNLGNTYTQINTVKDTTNNQSDAIWACLDVAHTGTPTVTLKFLPTPGTTQNLATVLNVDVFTIGPLGAQVDGNHAAVVASPGTGTDGVGSGTFATTVDGDVLYTAIFDGTTGNQSWTRGSGFGLCQDSNTITGMGFSSAYTIQPSHSGTTQTTWTATVGTDIYLVNAVALTPFVPSSVPASPAAIPGSGYNLAWQISWTEQRSARIAPLTLKYGDQPPRRVFEDAPFKEQLNLAWQTTWPAQRSPQIAPFTLVYGQQPRPLSQLASEFAQQVLSWPPPWPAQRGANIVPLTLTYGNPPPTVDADETPDQQVRWYLAWQTTWAAQRSPQIVPLTLTYGQQPPNVDPDETPDQQVRYALAWTTTWGVQSAAPNAAWNMGVAVVPPTVSPSLRDQYVLAWQVTWTAPEPVEIQPLALTYGDQPRPISQVASSLAQSNLAWQVTWGAQRAAPNAGWNTPYDLVPVQPTLLSEEVLAWQVTWGAQRGATIAPLTYATGDQPPTVDPDETPDQQARYFLAWQTTWGAQHGASIVPLTYATGDQPRPISQVASIYAQSNLAWQTTWGAQRGAQIVPLTFTYGQQPPPSGPMEGSADRANRTAISAWSTAWGAQSAGPVASFATPAVVVPPGVSPSILDQYVLAWQTTWPAQHGATIVPLTLAYGQQPPTVDPDETPDQQARYFLAWQVTWGAQTAAPNAGWNTPYDLVPVQPTLLSQEVLAWQVTWNAQRGATIAPLTLVYGQTPQDPDATPAQQSAYNLAWQVTWGAQRGASIVPLTFAYGSQPTPTGQIASALAQANLAWQVSWSAQTEADNADWNVVATTATTGIPAALKNQYAVAWQSTWGAQRGPTIVPLTLATGQQPPSIPPQSPDAQARSALAWTVTWGAQSAAPNAGWNTPYDLVPVQPTLLSEEVLAWQVTWGAQRAGPSANTANIYGDQPRPTSQLASVFAQSNLAWQATWAAQRSPQIVPLTLATGQQPRPTSQVASALAQSNLAWQTSWGAQSEADNAAWNIFYGFAPFPTITPSILNQYAVAWQSTWGAQHGATIVPLTLATGQQPTPQTFEAAPLKAQYHLAWQSSWNAQRGATIAPLTLVYGQTPQDPDATPAQQSAYNLAWQVTWGAQRGATIVPLTYATGDQPQPQPALQQADLSAVLAWSTTWGAQSAAPNAGWNFVVAIVPPTVSPSLLNQYALAWQTTWPAQHGASIVPLTFAYGQRPQDPNAAPDLKVAYAAAWQVTWPAQHGATIVPLTLATGDQPIPQPPADPDAQARAAIGWTTTWGAQHGATIVPLTLAYGKQPPTNPPADPDAMARLVAAWTPTWTAQRAAPVAATIIPAATHSGAGTSNASSVAVAQATGLATGRGTAVGGSVACGVGVAIHAKAPTITASSVNRASATSTASGTGQANASTVAVGVRGASKPHHVVATLTVFPRVEATITSGARVYTTDPNAEPRVAADLTVVERVDATVTTAPRATATVTVNGGP